MTPTEQALRQGAEMVTATAKQNIAALGLVDEGTLLNSVTYTIEGDEAIIGTPLSYGAYQELGTGLFAVNGDGRKDVPWAYQDKHGEWHSTSGVHPHPWLIPALDSNKAAIAKMLTAAMIKEALNDKH